MASLLRTNSGAWNEERLTRREEDRLRNEHRWSIELERQMRAETTAADLVFINGRDPSMTIRWTDRPDGTRRSEVVPAGSPSWGPRLSDLTAQIPDAMPAASRNDIAPNPRKRRSMKKPIVVGRSLVGYGFKKEPLYGYVLVEDRVAYEAVHADAALILKAGTRYEVWRQDHGEIGTEIEWRIGHETKLGLLERDGRSPIGDFFIGRFTTPFTGETEPWRRPHTTSTSLPSAEPSASPSERTGSTTSSSGSTTKRAKRARRRKPVEPLSSSPPTPSPSSISQSSTPRLSDIEPSPRGEGFYARWLREL